MASREDRRLALQALLEEALGSKNVYFEPPENLRMSYPCIRYNRAQLNTLEADNRKYWTMTTYDVTYIAKDPRDGGVIDRIMAIRYCSHVRHYVADNLHHDVFNIIT